MFFCPSLYHSEIFLDGRYLLNIYHAPAKGGVRTKMMVKTWSSLKMLTTEDRARYLIHSGSAAPSASRGWKTMGFPVPGAPQDSQSCQSGGSDRRAVHSPVSSEEDKGQGSDPAAAWTSNASITVNCSISCPDLSR